MMLHPGAPLGALAALAGAVLIYLTRQGTLGGAAAGNREELPPEQRLAAAQAARLRRAADPPAGLRARPRV